MTWGGLKKGDDAIGVYLIGEKVERSFPCKVLSVGPQWITVMGPGRQKTKFDAETGSGEFGYGLHTEATLANAHRRNAALRTIRTCWWGELSTELLCTVAALLAQEP